MEFGAQVGCYRNTWDNIRDSIEIMENGSWNSAWFADHYIPPPGRKEEEHLTAHEGFTVLAAVADFTKRLKLGHMVLGNTYRNPGLTAKMVLSSMTSTEIAARPPKSTLVPKVKPVPRTVIGSPPNTCPVGGSTEMIVVGL